MSLHVRPSKVCQWETEAWQRSHDNHVTNANGAAGDCALRADNRCTTKEHVTNNPPTHADWRPSRATSLPKIIFIKLFIKLN